MSQEHLNNLMLLKFYKERLADGLNLLIIATKFNDDKHKKIGFWNN